MKRSHLLITVLIGSSCSLLAFSNGYAEGKDDSSYLNMDLAQLMQVTLTSATKKEQSLDQTAAAAFVITESDIHRSGATTIPELLAMVPGIQVAQISSSKWSVASRGFGGFTSNKLLVMIDGRSVYTPAYSGTYWDMQNVMLEDIDRIEVIRGPGGTLWGANAVNGVINIITKESQDTIGQHVRVSMGSQEQNAAVRHGETIGSKAFGRVYAMASDYDSNDLADSSRDAHDAWNNIQSGFRLDGITDADNDWTLQGDVYRNNGDQTVYPYWISTAPYLTEDRSGYDAMGANLNGQWQHRLENDDLLRVKSYLDYNDREESYFDQTFTTWDLDLQYEKQLGSRNALTIGTGYRYIDSEFRNTFQVSNPDQNTSLYSAFIQDEIKLIEDALWLTLGTKYEHNDFTGSEWQPSARLLWKPEANHSLWTSVARAVRTPSLIEDSGKVTIASFPIFIPPATLINGSASILGSSSFDSEEVIAYEAGYRWQAKENLSFDTAIYYNAYDDLYSAIPGASPTALDFANVNSGSGYGVELAVNWQPLSWWTLNLAYSWQKISLDSLDLASGGLSAQQAAQNSLPQNQLSLRSKLVFSEQWQTNWWLQYIDTIENVNSLTLTDTVKIPSRVQLSANIIWTPRQNMEVMLAGRNLLYDERLQYAAELVSPPTEIERDIFLQLSWKF